MAKRPPKQTYYQRSEAYAKQVSGEIIEQIKKGTAPWQEALETGGTTLGASNLATGKAYSGGEQLVSHEPSDQRGPGRQQVGEPTGRSRRLGGQVRRGERGTTSPCSTGTGRSNRRKTRTGKIHKDKEGKTIYEETENGRGR